MTTANWRPLPLTIEEIDRQWLTGALRIKAPDITVRDFKILDVIRGTTTKIRLRLILDDAGRRAGIPELVILKGGFEAHSRALGPMLEREVRGYRDVLPTVPLPAPACYYADYDAERQQGIIIMDDLVARGVTFCHATRPQTHEQIARRLTVLAQFHARTWASPELAPGGQWGDLADFFEGMLQTFFDQSLSPGAWQRIVGSPRGASTSVRFHDRDWMLDSWPRLIRFCRQLPHCVLHGDVHLGNVYIERDGTPGFLDTLTSRGPGMLEVSYYISASLDIADRRRSEGALVQHYLDELARNGVGVPSYDQAMRQYGTLLLYGHLVWMGTDPYMQTEAVNTANAARVSAAMIDHDIVSLLRSINAT